MIKNQIILLDPYSNARWGGGGSRAIWNMSKKYPIYVGDLIVLNVVQEYKPFHHAKYILAPSHYRVYTESQPKGNCHL